MDAGRSSGSETCRNFLLENCLAEKYLTHFLKIEEKTLFWKKNQTLRFVAKEPCKVKNVFFFYAVQPELQGTENDTASATIVSPVLPRLGIVSLKKPMVES